MRPFFQRSRAVKGPSGRLKFDVRRVWECPTCRRREQTGGQVVFLLCPGCIEQGKPQVWMRLVEEKLPKP
jgi:hypothetical protein